MNKLFRHSGLLLLKCLFLLGPAQADTELKAGSAAPGFNLKDQNYKHHKLEDYRGRWLVLYFYPKNDTPGCTTEACNFRDDIFKIKALDGVVLGVSLDDSKSHAEFAEKYSLPFSLLADTDGKVSASYNALTNFGPIKFSKRHSFIIGPDGTIKKVYRSVNPDSHSQEVIDDLKSLIAETES